MTLKFLKHSSHTGTRSSASMVVGLVALGFLSGCNSTGNALPTSDTEKPAIVSAPIGTGAPELRKLSGKSGTGIAVLVNKTPITNNDIRRRANFVKLRRMKGNSRTVATNELIEEAIKMNEARRLRTVASAKEVDAAYIRFAKGNKMPVKVLGQIMEKRGITKQGFKQFIRASISWQKAMQLRLRAEAQGTVNQQARTSPAWLPPVGTSSGKEEEYTLQQVVFSVPQGKTGLVAARKSEANRFRGQMDGCTNAKTLAVNLRNVAVLDRGRTLESELPPRWADEIKAMSVGKVTKPKTTEKGVELLAICRKREVIGKVRPDGNKDLFDNSKFRQAASEVEKKYLAELKERVVIERR